MPGFTRRVAEFCKQDTDTTSRSGHADGERAGPRRGSRRRLLAAGGGAAAALLAGCSDVVPGIGGISADDEPTDGTDTGTPATPTSEANVVSLMYREEGSDYRFFVGIDPPNETRGADWWQVETLDGAKVERKEFDSPRAGDRFETAATVTVDDPSAGLVVRAHDADVGYGGQVMLANIEQENLAIEKQGSEKQSFENYSF